MAIWAYVGLPRQGKSYNVVAEQIIPALKAGRRVVTNIPLVVDELRARGCTGEVYQIDQNKLADYQKNPAGVEAELAVCTPGSVCVFDEVWRYLPQGLQAKHVPAAWATLFAEHGHRVDAEGRMMQIVLCTQDLSQIAAFARSLVERTCVVTKLTAIGVTSKYRVDVYAGHVTGLKPPAAKRISEAFGSYDAEIFKCYVSRTMAEGSAGKVDERVMSGRGTALGHPMIRFGMPIAVCLIAWGLWRTYEFFFVAPAAAQAAGEAVKPKAESSWKREASAPATATRLMRLRIAAVIRSDDDTASRVLIDHCDGTPSRWVLWYAARCADGVDGSIGCEWGGRRYEFHAAVDDCRESFEPRSAEIRWFPSDDSGSREQVPVMGKAVD